MKTNCWLILGMMVATSAIAQDNTNALPPIPAPITSPASAVSPAPAAVDTNAPMTKPVKKTKPVRHKKRKLASAERIRINEPTVTLVPGPATVDVKNVNVRGQAGLKGEVVAHLKQGETVTVLDQINLDRHKAGEPAQWAKIALPASTHVWVFSAFVDKTGKTVLARKLNLRAGPGENYSVLGVIERGTPVTEITTKGKWMQIDPPADAYAFVAAMYLKQEAVAANPTPAVVTPVPAPQPMTPAPAPPAAPTTTRVVAREGVVGPVASIVAPTAYKLYDPDTYQTIDYLYTTATDLDLSRYVNMRVIATGEEALDKRWKNTPMLTIESIQVIDANAIKVTPIKHNH
ncbi:MAG: SH3 domain-containing protein [Limisphaerales bacterium]